MFDACQVGVVLRAVLFVEVVVGVGAMYGASSPVEWLASLALLTGGALPSHAGVAGHGVQPQDGAQRLSTAQQYAAGVLLGAVAGAYACAMLALVGLSASPPGWPALPPAHCWQPCWWRRWCCAPGAAPRLPPRRALTELQSRIRPHFCSTRSTVPLRWCVRKPAKAESLLEDLSDLFRVALIEQGESTTLAEEITLGAALPGH